MKVGAKEPLAHIMKALGNPVRMELLRQLTTPRQLGEIQVHPHRREAGGAPKRLMSRASVQSHLEQLLEVGAVRTLTGIRDGRNVTLYTIDERQLFALTEELRDLGRLRGKEASLDGTAAAPALPHRHEGPRLILMSGPWEGRVIPLDGAGPWTLGRGNSCDVSLPYDPYLSMSNSEVRRTKGDFSVADLAHSRNGTALNWVALPRGQQADLRSGDVVGIGRTLVMFRAS